MAEDFIERIYADCMIYEKIKECAELMYKRSTSAFSDIWNKYNSELVRYIGDIEQIDQNMAEELRVASYAVRDAAGDMLYCASIIEERLLPIIKECLSKKNQINVNYGSINIVSSKIGFLSLRDSQTGRLYNSMYDPMWEARKYAEQLYDTSKNALVIMGIGLGYLAYQIWLISEKSMDIYVYETDARNIDIACNYGVLSWIPSDKLHIFIYDNQEILEQFINADVETEKSVFLISEVAMSVLNKDDFERATSFMINQKAASFYDSLYAVNYRENSINILLSESEKQSVLDSIPYWNKEAVVVAAGPSLDSNVDFIKESKGKRIIIAVNTVVKRLIKEGIEPDIVAVIDPNEGIMPHINGIEPATEKLTLVAESCAYWGYVNSFRGKKYRINALDCSYEGDEISKNGKWEVSGTVSSLAIQIAIFFEVNKIYMAGLDLAYPENKCYAGNLGTGKSNISSGNMTVRSVDGGMVNSSYVFDGFRKGIENKIADNPNITFINLSESGAMIKGSLSGQWWEAISGLRDIESEVGIRDIEKYISRLSFDKSLTWSEKYYLLMILKDQIKDQKLKNYKNTIDNILNNGFQSILSEFYRLQDVNSLLEVLGEKNDTTNIVYLLTTGESIDNGVLYEQMMNDAEKIRHQLKLPVLILNTNEYLGGECIATDYQAETYIERLNSSCDRLVYHGEEYPCVVMDYPMPNTEILKMYLGILLKKKPKEIIVYDKYSIILDLLSKFVVVEEKSGQKQ